MCQRGYYSPAIDPDLIPHLYYLARDEGQPMTRLVSDIIRTELHIRGIINDEEAQAKRRKLRGVAAVAQR
jgi:hypothetical protein